jgi:predicted nucleotide-binding protein (sugar kinase/HSP70/actin superfamily)
MSYSSARLMAAAFHSVGVDAAVTPDSNGETLEIGGLYSSGEECLPHKITLGDFLRICRRPGAEASRIAFFMPRAQGPCRFGQYAPYLKQVLEEEGFGEVLILSPDSTSNYDEIGDHASDLMRTVWMGIVVSDLVSRYLLKTRPYELRAGDTDEVFRECVERLGKILARPDLNPKQRLRALVAENAWMRDRFHSVPARYEKGRPFIGLVGEIFCRLNTFSNDDVARRIEQLGGECWLSDISEWIWYTNWSRETDCVRDDGRFNWEFLKLKLKTRLQQAYEKAMLAPVHDDFKGYEEPHDIREILRGSEPYLPATGALGEMTLSVGKAVYLYSKGIDGVIDISPFTCMNGIVSEAVYPAVSAAHGNLPIRSLYFDNVSTKIERDLEIFLDLARAYQRRKTRPRVYPDYFH